MSTDNIFGALEKPDGRAAAHREDAGGLRHRDRVRPADPVPGAPIELLVTASSELALDLVRCFATVERDEAASGSAAIEPVDLRPAAVAWDTVAWTYLTEWRGALPAQPPGTTIRYRIGGRVAGTPPGVPERWVWADTQAADEAGATEFSLWVADDPVPAWARDATVYHVFIDRFEPGEGRPWLEPADLAGFYGGTIRGVIERLDYIADLGCDTIWLSPVFASPSHHGYDATDYYRVEPRLGTNEDLRELIEAVHGRGMRILLDFVANHWSHEHPTFVAAKSDRDSPYHDWYTWTEWPDGYASYFGVRTLPELNLRRGPARDEMLAIARHWLAQDVDGFRLDYAYGPPHDFWTDFRRACRAVRPDCWIFGEIIHTPEVQASYAGRMDGTLDFVLASALRETFGRGSRGIDWFEGLLRAHEAYFPPGFLLPAFVDNHDMDRFLMVAGGDTARLRLALLVLFTLAGPPIVYYGTEAGVTQTRWIHGPRGGGFEQARAPMRWGQEQDAGLLEFVRRLARLRRELPVLRRGSRRVVHLDAAAGTYAYLREGPEGRAAMVLNTSAESRTVRLPLGGLQRDALGGCPVRAGGPETEVTLPARSGALIV